MSDAAQKWAIITPTYHLDYEQFKLMGESVDRFVEGSSSTMKNLFPNLIKYPAALFPAL